VPGWGPLVDVDQWEGAMWHMATEVVSLCAAIWHLFLLLWTIHRLPSGGCDDVACDMDQSGPAMCLWLI
jgi:hypothetical protein